MGAAAAPVSLFYAFRRPGTKGTKSSAVARAMADKSKGTKRT
jgi:hypothetical protein